MMTEIITEHELVNEEASYEVKISVNWSWVDNGIGHYEWWGSSEFQTKMELEVESFYIECVTVNEEYSGVVSYTVTRDEKDEFTGLWADVEAWVNSEVEELDAPEVYYDDDDYDYHDDYVDD